MWFKTLKPKLETADHLSTSSFALGGSFDDSGQVEQLDVGVLVLDDARDAGQRRELVGRRHTLGLRQGAQQSRLKQEVNLNFTGHDDNPTSISINCCSWDHEHGCVRLGSGISSIKRLIPGLNRMIMRAIGDPTFF